MSNGLDAKAAWLQRVLGVVVSASAASPLDELNAALMVLAKRISAVVAANPAAREGLVALANSARDKIKVSDAESASADIERLSAALDAAKRAPQAPQASASTSRTAGVDVAPASQVDLGALSARLDAARRRAAALADPNRFTDDLLAVDTALGHEDGAAAAGLLDSIEGRIRSAERAHEAAQEIADAKAQLGLGAVRLAKLRRQLRELEAGRGLAVSQLQASCRAVLDTEPDNPRYEEGIAAVANIGIRVPAPSPELSAAIDEIADTADAIKQAAGREKALDEIRRYRAALDADPMLQTLENTPAGSFKIYSQMVESLTALDIGLSA